jgi:hypothetical protein
VSFILDDGWIAVTGAGLLISLPNKANTIIKPNNNKNFMAKRSSL